MIFRIIKSFLYDRWREIDAEPADPAAPAAAPAEAAPMSKAERRRRARAAERARGEPAAAGPYDFRPLVVLVTVAVSLTLQEYIGEREFFTRHFGDLAVGEHGELMRHGWWALWRFLGYVVLPVIVILCLPGERVRDYYLSFKAFRQKAGVYLVLFLLILPVVILAPRLFSGFYLTYPFYKWANRSAFDLWAWEAMYAVQFMSLEFFFRGFMLKALRPRFGSHAIFVMIVPYCMIHYGKPMPETLGAIIAGLVLGTLAMRTRSIWGGVLIHISVAITMDMMAVANCPPASAGRPCPSH
ncbi:MAG TPA: type II CAAX endopeptidase family protein [Kofleriaceae bacterium]|nr:type II CAAX endopeptidase family protein [Kofleriaceae bacterium]